VQNYLSFHQVLAGVCWKHQHTTFSQHRQYTTLGYK